MSDLNDSNGNGTASREPSGQPPLVVHSQYVRDLSFENPNAPASLAGQKEAPKIEVKLDVGARRLQEQIYELLLKIDLTAKQAEQSAFLAHDRGAFAEESGAEVDRGPEHLHVGRQAFLDVIDRVGAVGARDEDVGAQQCDGEKPQHQQKQARAEAADAKAGQRHDQR